MSWFDSPIWGSLTRVHLGQKQLCLGLGLSEPEGRVEVWFDSPIWGSLTRVRLGQKQLCLGLGLSEPEGRVEILPELVNKQNF